MTVGTVLASGRVHAALGVAVLIVAYWRKIRMEEDHMCNVFGAEYQRYRKESWALVPPII